MKTIVIDFDEGATSLWLKEKEEEEEEEEEEEDDEEDDDDDADDDNDCNGGGWDESVHVKWIYLLSNHYNFICFKSVSMSHFIIIM